jgi:hypothetical protein
MTIDNEVSSLGGVPGFELDWFNRIEEGRPMGALEIPMPYRDAAGEYSGEWDWVWLQPFADKIFNLGLKVRIGNNFSMQIYGDGQFGGHTMNITRLYRYEGGGGVVLPDPEDGDHMVFNQGTVPDGYWSEEAFAAFMEKNDYFKIREFSATYRIPKKMWGSDVSLTFTARNFWNVFVPNKTIDPEMNSAGLGWGQGDSDLGINSAVEAEFSPPIQYSFGVTIDM